MAANPIVRPIDRRRRVDLTRPPVVRLSDRPVRTPSSPASAEAAATERETELVRARPDRSTDPVRTADMILRTATAASSVQNANKSAPLTVLGARQAADLPTYPRAAGWH